MMILRKTIKDRISFDKEIFEHRTVVPRKDFPIIKFPNLNK
jgi:hypothetical protein